MVGIGSQLADQRGVVPQWMRTHRRQQLGCVGTGADGDQLALVGHVERVQSQQFAGGCHYRFDRNRALLQHHADPGLAGNFVQGGGEAAARGVAQAADVGARCQHRCDQAVQRRGVGNNRGVERQVLALAHDGHAMVAHGARDQHHIARSGAAAAEFQTLGQDADGGGGDEDAVALAAFHHLGVARYHRHAGHARSFGHRFDDARQIGQRKAFFEDETGSEIERCGAHHRHVVHGAMHRQAADVATRKEQGRHHMAVGRHHDACRLAVQHRRRQHCAVVALTQVLVAQVLGEQFRDQLHHGAPARAMRQIDPTVLQIEWPHIASFDISHQFMSL